MGIFFARRPSPARTDQIRDQLFPVLNTAYKMRPGSEEEAGRFATESADSLSTQLAAMVGGSGSTGSGGTDPTGAGAGPRQFIWWRFLLTLLFMVMLYFVYSHCAHDDKMAKMADVLLHFFQVMAGAIVGSIIGEAVQ